MEKKLRNGFKIFYIVSLATALIILLRTANRSTLQALTHAKPRYLCLAIGFTLLYWLADIVRVKVLTMGLGERLSFRAIAEILFAHIFFSAITPFSSGGGPLQVYMMYKEGIPTAKGIAVTGMRFVLSIIIVGLTAPTIILSFPNMIQTTSIKYLYIYTLLSFSMAVLFYITIMFWPTLTKMVLGILINSLHRLRLVKGECAEKWKVSANNVVEEFSMSFKNYFGQGKWYLLLSFLITGVYLFAQFSVPVALMWAFGINVNLFEILVSQIVLTAVMYFFPTPGSSGVAEGGFALIFIRYVPSHLIGVVVLLWRFLLTYLGVMAGAYVFFKVLGSVTMSTIMSVSKGDNGDKERKDK